MWVYNHLPTKFPNSEEKGNYEQQRQTRERAVTRKGMDQPNPTEDLDVAKLNIKMLINDTIYLRR